MDETNRSLLTNREEEPSRTYCEDSSHHISNNTLTVNSMTSYAWPRTTVVSADDMVFDWRTNRPWRSQPTSLNVSFSLPPRRTSLEQGEYRHHFMEEESLYNDEPLYHSTWASQAPSRVQSSLQTFGERRPGNYSFHFHHNVANNLFNRSRSQLVRGRNALMYENERKIQKYNLHDTEQRIEPVTSIIHNKQTDSCELATSHAVRVGGSDQNDEETVIVAGGVEDDVAYTEMRDEASMPEFAIESIEDEVIGGWEPSEKWPSSIKYIIRFLHWYAGRLTGYDQTLNLYGFYPSWDQLIAFIFSCITLVVLGLIEHYGFHPLINHTLHIFLPAFGASTTVVFCVPKAPISQPRALFLSHVFAAIIGVCLANALHRIPNTLLGECVAGSLGVGIHLALMQVTNTLHPPASATVISATLTPLNEYYHDQGFLFVISPVALGSIYVIIMASLLNNLVTSRAPYPQY